MFWKVIIGVIFFVSIVGTIIIVPICVENETMDIFLLLGKRKVRIGDNHRNYLKYKGMELEKRYKPQELGIRCKNNPKGEIKHG